MKTFRFVAVSQCRFCSEKATTQDNTCALCAATLLAEFGW